LLVLGDVFVTVFSTGGAGPLTALWTAGAWRSVIAVHRRRPIHRALAYVGPFLLIATVCIWYFILNAALVCLLRYDPWSAEQTTDGTPLTFLQTIYLVGATLSTVGYGDLAPTKWPWTFVMNLYTFFASIVVTSSLSFLISVVKAAVDRKAVAQSIFALGHTPAEFVRYAQLHASDGRHMVPQVVSICAALDNCAFEHLAYPILHYFHNPTWSRSPTRAALVLSDAHFIYENVLVDDLRPASGALHLIESSLLTYTDVAANRTTSMSKDEDAPIEGLLNELHEVELEMRPQEEWQNALEEYCERRRWLLAMCDEDGWSDDHYRRARPPADEKANG